MFELNVSVLIVTEFRSKLFLVPFAEMADVLLGDEVLMFTVEASRVTVEVPRAAIAVMLLFDLFFCEIFKLIEAAFKATVALEVSRP